MKQQQSSYTLKVYQELEASLLPSGLDMPGYVRLYKTAAEMRKADLGR